MQPSRISNYGHGSPHSRRPLTAFTLALGTIFTLGFVRELFAENIPGAQRPNIVMLLADDQCTYSMGCYATPGAKTPKLDQLARDGMIFDRHYDTTAICMASRVSIMTGRYEYKSGCNFDSGPLLGEFWQESYPALLRSSGYQVAFAGKFGFLVADKPGGKGELPAADFDRWGGGPGQTSYSTAKNASMAKYADRYPHSTLSYGAFGSDFVRSMASGQAPFCLSISFKAPHHPVQPDPKFDSVYANATFRKPANYGRQHGAHLSMQSRQGRQYERFHSWNYSSDYDKVMARYYQQIYAIDVAVGMIRQALEESGLSENTVIIYSSDNGFLCGSHGYGSKVLPYEESSRVPLIVFDPRHPSSGKQLRCDALTGNVDLAPTILGLAGIPIPERIDGANLMRLLDDPNASLHKYLPLINVWGPKQVHSFGVVTESFKYVYWPYAADGMQATEELFDMRNDTLELHNLLTRDEYREMLEAARAVYRKANGHWREEAVSFHGYRKFATIFDPKVAWDKKARLYAK